MRVVTGYPHYPHWHLSAGYRGWKREEVLNGVSLQRVRHYIPQKVTNLRRMHMELSFGFRTLLSDWGKPDVVLVVSPALFAAALGVVKSLFLKRQPVPVGVWVQDLYSKGLSETGQNPIVTNLIKRLEGWVLRSATGVAVIHERFKDYLVAELGVPAGNVTVIRNWTHVEPAVIDRARMRRQMGWKSDELIVLHAGNMGAKQALENVIDAASLAQERNLKIRFVLLGDGNQRSSLARRAEGVETVHMVMTLDEDDFLQALGSADILLVNEMVGLREMAVPSKLTTYFLTGLPVLAATDANSTTAAEISRAKAGVRVEPGLPEKLIEGVLALAADPDLAQILGSSGRLYAEKELSKDSAIIHFDQWLAELSDHSRHTDKTLKRTTKGTR